MKATFNQIVESIFPHHKRDIRMDVSFILKPFIRSLAPHGACVFGNCLLMMIMDKEVACFFFLGFALSVYLGIPVTAIAIFGAIIAIVLTQLRSNSAQTATEGGLDEDDDF